MPLIDAATLDTLRALSEDAMPDTVVLRTPAGYTLNESGSRVMLPEVSVTTKGRLEPPGLKESDRETERLGTLTDESALPLAVPLDVPVSGISVAEITAARYGTTKRYEIVQVLPLGSYSVHRTLIVRPETQDDKG